MNEGDAVLLSPGVCIWYDKAGGDERPWLVRTALGVTMRARSVGVEGSAETDFAPAGFLELQPGGPRAIIRTSGHVELRDAVSV